MRVVLVGSAADRARLRKELPADGVDVVGEAATLADARELAREADAFVLATHLPRRDGTDRNPEFTDETGVSAETLTPRETDVLSLLALGLSNKAIAARLGISDQTAKFHVASIIGKLGADNRTDALARAARRGLIDL